MFHLLLGELHMGHRLDVIVACDGQQALVGNCGMVHLDVGELGDGGRLKQPGIVQPGAVEGQKVQLAALQGGQAAAVDSGVAVQKQIAQLGHGGKDRKAGVCERALLHTDIDHIFMSGKGHKQFIRHWIVFHMEAHQGVTSQPLHDLRGQLRDFKLLLSV